MASIDLIRASDGTDNAQVATVQSARSGGASTIAVDTVAGINDTFMASMGTPHTFTDPVTSETITVISEATAVDFSGHVDGSNLEIDTIAPGYTDGGSEIGDVVIIRPTTQYADNIADVLDVSHNDDGTLKNGAVDDAAVLASNVVTSDKIIGDAVTTAKIDDGAVTADKLGLSPQTASVLTSQTTTSATPIDLATAGPSVSVTIGANGLALIFCMTNYNNNTVGEGGLIYYTVSGATTVAATEMASFRAQAVGSAGTEYINSTMLVSGLNPGSNTFKMQYSSGTGGTGTFSNRRIVVIPL